MRRGVTLTELVVVITLTLILCAAALGGLHGVQTWRSAAAVRRVQADLQYARDLALLSSRRTQCVLDTAAGNYEIRQEAQPGTGALVTSTLAHPITGLPWSVSLASLASGAGFTVQPTLTGGALGFGPDGLPLNSAGGAIGSDVQITFTTGALLTVRGCTGLCEVTWP